MVLALLDLQMNFTYIEDDLKVATLLPGILGHPLTPAVYVKFVKSIIWNVLLGCLIKNMIM